ncbi:ATP-dependent DNA helicase [Jeotgalibacillus haloalkalitolerans]|uniref:ATP-dependent DNA helicase n=1 Tax=Jeotgalibacillus haloalkalitolerans TaxID=3104292 RepID=A0ABU5KL24_9BACL|nr:ATP-dependent DNA helicase [Jeotgalibacillus sp. HH7-29]MDZ5711969.1 ATP-dependent DNA helicase [Jeotgalibacillus sp. HH7-29]
MNTKSLPFPVTSDQSFYEALGDWIGDVFYDILPEKGLELRDEQIFMAFQLEQAYKNKSVIFAEAGVGTGKTIAYLLYAVAYARYTGRPAIIACADETLIEQLVKPTGDIKKIEQMLDMEIDVRLAKSREQYLCLKKLDEADKRTEDEAIEDVYLQLPEFVYGAGSMSSFYPYGDRKEYPYLDDEQWQAVNYDSLQDCLSCDVRHRCGQTLHREYYRQAGDLIVCSHDFYMEHIWTKDARVREGQLPLLPEASSVIFDEGHLLEYAAQKALTYKTSLQSMEKVLSKLSGNDVREKTLLLIDSILEMHDDWFALISKSADRSSERMKIKKTDQLIQATSKLKKSIDDLLEELVFESEMYVIDEYDLKISEEYLETVLFSLKLLVEDDNAIIWLEENFDDERLVIMPRMVEEILREEVFSKKLPFIFSSATLSVDEDFTYLAASLGIDDYSSFTVESPYEYEEVMKIQIRVLDQAERANAISEIVNENEGGSLILFNNHEDQNLFRFTNMIEEKQCLYEGDEEISTLVEKFQEDTSSVLASINLWEGLDVPGLSLNQVMIESLPFPPDDPVFEAKRNHAEDPMKEVDLPYMLLRLQQGAGRLIRSSSDKGNITIFLSPEEEKWIPEIKKILPVEPEVVK